ncbi:MAG: hypothetical protein IH895_02925 [Planctomycetes bacterium]|nr:hypothetical protein [Planctomycetota bacterium]
MRTQVLSIRTHLGAPRVPTEAGRRTGSAEVAARTSVREDDARGENTRTRAIED